jgi:hypothetical protein
MGPRGICSAFSRWLSGLADTYKINSLAARDVGLVQHVAEMSHTVAGSLKMSPLSVQLIPRQVSAAGLKTFKE